MACWVSNWGLMGAGSSFLATFFLNTTPPPLFPSTFWLSKNSGSKRGEWSPCGGNLCRDIILYRNESSAADQSARWVRDIYTRQTLHTSWYLYRMVAQNVWGTYEVKYAFSKKTDLTTLSMQSDAFNKSKYLIYMCVPCSELPSNISTMVLVVQFTTSFGPIFSVVTPALAIVLILH